jgi:putative cardiolipin synthase
MGMLKTLVGSRVPAKYRKYLNLPTRHDSWRIVNTADTPLGQAAARWRVGRAEKCGVLRLNRGIDALSLRIGLIERAERCIDIQSFLVKDDLSGNLIALKLIEAADRGVRVRLLMDDALTQDIDAGLVSINDHVNIEVRLFNPFPRRRSRFLSLISNFNILNRRMHNKSFTVDSQVCIVGGRNIADEYFQSSSDNEFLDEDLFAIGPVVDEVAEGFDEYWNTLEAIPINNVDNLAQHAAIADTIENGREFIDDHRENPVLRGLDDSLAIQFMAARLPLVEADAHLVLDHPDKVRGLIRNQTGETANFLQQMVSSGTEEVIIVSPYFVPQRRGVDFLTALVRQGVRVAVITNSLASTNHSSVHAVYARYRKPLLRQGVELYELRPRLTMMADGEERPDLKMTLHSKLAVVDRHKLFVGSFNLDPRSLYINTEMGMAVDSRELATRVAKSLGASLQNQTYSLRLARTGGLRWKYLTRDGAHIARTEPHTSLWRRFKTRLMSFLPIESQM